MATFAGLLCRFFDGGRNEILKPNMHMHACVCACACMCLKS